MSAAPYAPQFKVHSLHMLHDLHIVVVCDGGWSWALAWVEMGVLQVDCLPLTLLARIYLTRVVGGPMLGSCYH